MANIQTENFAPTSGEEGEPFLKRLNARKAIGEEKLVPITLLYLPCTCFRHRSNIFILIISKSNLIQLQVHSKAQFLTSVFVVYVFL